MVVKFTEVYPADSELRCCCNVMLVCCVQHWLTRFFRRRLLHESWVHLSRLKPHSVPHNLKNNICFSTEYDQEFGVRYSLLLHSEDYSRSRECTDFFDWSIPLVFYRENRISYIEVYATMKIHQWERKTTRRQIRQMKN